MFALYGPVYNLVFSLAILFMKTKTYRLDRFIQKHTGAALSAVHLMVAQKRIGVDNAQATSVQQLIGEFTRVTLDDEILQNNYPRYIALHKPKGVVSATCDKKHKTVIDLLPCEIGEGLHLVGRLDFNSTGLMLLTNDGQWSRAINDSLKKVPKHYRVTLDKPIDKAVVEAFNKGIYFAYENVTTQPAQLTMISPREALVVITDGRYHQIKRMFGHFQIEVLTLHRFKIGDFELDDQLPEGAFSVLSEAQCRLIVKL